MEPQEYVNLHGWYTQGLSLGQIDLDMYKAAVKTLTDNFVSAKQEVPDMDSAITAGKEK